jgi:transposase
MELFMYIESIANRKSPPSILLRESFRENGVVKKRTIANLTKWPEKLISDMKTSLRGNRVENTAESHLISTDQFQVGKVFGVLSTLKKLADEIGLTNALGNTRLAKLTLFLVLVRIAHQGSRLSAVRWARNHAVKEILDLSYFNEDDLYDALDWAEENQENIEKKLYKKYSQDKGSPPVLVLYDVTSSYFEGEQNEMSEYGYNRDKKKGKKQIVIGLLTASDGEPLSIEVFQGNTSDPITVNNQVKKLIYQFDIDEVIFVGDRGMVKTEGKKAIQSKEGFYYISALTEPQIRKLLKQEILQIDMFDKDIIEIDDNNGKRYILRRCEVRQRKEHHRREDKLSLLKKKIIERNDFVMSSKKAKPESGLKTLMTFTKQYKLSSFVTLFLKDDNIKITIDDAKKEDNALLDGCYVVETDISNEKMDKTNVWDRYGDLQKVERDFRRMKTTLLEIRPIFVRKKSRTKGHVFISMLALKISRIMESRLFGAFKTTHESDDAVTIEDAIDTLSRLCLLQYNIETQVVSGLPRSDEYQQKILDALGVKIIPPKTLPSYCK